MEAVRARIEERQFQIFDLYVTKGWSPSELAKTLGISIARLYLTEHRLAALLRKKVKRLEKATELRSRRQC